MVAVLLALLPGAGTAAAQVIHDNGAPDYQVGGGVSVSNQYNVANDFTLAATATLDRFTWYGMHMTSGAPSTVLSNFSWQIFADALGQPGTEIATGNVIGATGTKTGLCCNGFDLGTVYLFEAALGNLVLGPGTYWLGLSGYASAGVDAGYWAASSPDGNAHWRGGSIWVPAGPFNEGEESAFAIFGPSDVVATPEPTSLLLMATGLAGVAACAARRRKRTVA